MTIQFRCGSGLLLGSQWWVRLGDLGRRGAARRCSPDGPKAATEVSVAVWLTLEKTTPAPTVAPITVFRPFGSLGKSEESSAPAVRREAEEDRGRGRQ